MKIMIIWTENLLQIISSLIASIQLKIFVSPYFHLLKATDNAVLVDQPVNINIKFTKACCIIYVFSAPCGKCDKTLLYHNTEES